MTNSHFSENDIRPTDLNEEKNIAILMDLSRILAFKTDFITVNCPACNSSLFHHKFKKQGLDYVVCSKCKTLFMNPRPSKKALEDLYKHSKVYSYWNKTIFPVSETARRVKIFKPRVNYLLDYCNKLKIKTNSLLEVGAGFGIFCAELESRHKFQQIVAIEPTTELAATCRTKGFKTKEDIFENINFSKKERYDVIVCFEVIEHLFSPKIFLNKCYKLLNPGGLLYFTCPNVEGFDYIVLGKLNPGIDHEHLNYFNTKSLRILLTKNNFKPIEISTPGKLDAEIVRNSIINNEFDDYAYPYLHEILIERWNDVGQNFQDFLSANNLSSSMQALAQKI